MQRNTWMDIFFLHLLGCDNMSHSYKLQSRSTAYIFRTDHGITDWGLHGSGSTDETETSLIAWGAGVNSTGARYDVDQADITPLILTLIGSPLPSNNEVSPIIIPY
ncbi:hypothetical protein M0804_013893 [Polistes exclamans]|nr:hypothetical protein M0804_013893 [Polistes exclamans]